MSGKQAKYSVPENIRAMRPEGTLVKNIKGLYYVYEHIRVKDPKTGKMKNGSGKMLGKITLSDGFMPAGKKERVFDDEISVLDFGQYASAYYGAPDTMARIRKYFPDEKDWQTLVSMGIIYAVDGYTPINRLKSVYDGSWLSERFPKATMGEESAASFLSELARRDKKARKFCQSLAEENSGFLAIDGHVILCCSKNSCLASVGNKFRKISDSQMNFLCVFDVEKNRPVSIQAIDGGTLDKTSVENVFRQNTFVNTVFLADMGFWSDDNLKLFTGNGCHYIIPASENLKIYKDIAKDLSFQGEFVYRKGKRKSDTAVISYKETATEDGKRVILFRDNMMNQAQRAEYLPLIGERDGFTKEDYERLSGYFGVIVLVTDMLDRPASEIYADYKKRWRIETYYEHFRNVEDVNGIHKQDYYQAQGECFVMTIEGLIYSELLKRLPKGKCYRETLSEVARQKISCHKDGTWHTIRLRKQIGEYLKGFGVDVGKCISELGIREILTGNGKEKTGTEAGQ